MENPRSASAENPDFRKLHNLVKDLIETETALNPREHFILQIYPNLDKLERIEELFDRVSPIDHEDLKTNSVACVGGEAISPALAARCLRDVIRTSRFITGLHQAIWETRRKLRTEKVRVLDAGSGPWGLLSVAAATQFSPDEVEFSLLDIHFQSLENCRALIKRLGMEAYFNQFIQADAATVNLSDHLPQKPHITIAELMNAGLMEEPQASATMNLAPQCDIFIPEQVSVSANLITDTHELKLGEILELTREKALKTLSDGQQKEVTVTTSFDLPEDVSVAKLMLAVKAHIYNGFKLEGNDSFITRSYPMGRIKRKNGEAKLQLDIKFGGNRYDAKYQLT
jgi:hypothetical protein